jgi:dihydroorotase
MRLKDVQHLELPPSADMHVHLRQGEVSLISLCVGLVWTNLCRVLQVMELVAPQVRKGGVDVVFVMACKVLGSSVYR